MPTSLVITPAVPVIETERLRMRGHRIDDFPHSTAMWADAKVVQYIGGKVQTEEESWTRFLRYVGHWVVLGFGYWVIEEKATSAFVGEIGFAHYKRDMQPCLNGLPEIGWALASAYHGRGYATEAVRSVVAWSDQHFDSLRTACIIALGNDASVRVATKCGYIQSGGAIYKGRSVRLFMRDAGAARTRSETP
jgi:RimJ/RimL family protein N-acetyltransferase